MRRGLSTNLYELGVQPKIIQAILRHSHVETTNRHYIIIQQQKAGSAAMKKLESAVKRAQSVHKAKAQESHDHVKTLIKIETKWSRGRELNSRPADYESAALPLSYLGFATTYRDW